MGVFFGFSGLLLGWEDRVPPRPHTLVDASAKQE